MLLLVVADRHQMGAVEQDVRRHQDRVGVQPEVGADLLRLLLELGHAVEDPGRRHRPQDPCQLGVLRHLALVVQQRALRVDPDGEQDLGRLVALVHELHGILRDGDGVEVHDAVDGVVVVLEPHPVAERPEIVPQVHVPGGLHSTEHSLSVHRLLAGSKKRPGPRASGSWRHALGSPMRKATTSAARRNS